MQAPGVQINQLMCSEVPGDQPIVHFINVLEFTKMPSGTTITKKTGRIKMQVGEDWPSKESAYNLFLDHQRL